ncbi:hypothetical protein BT96DRAFT_295733 [Gymnopus androsaceus JB14]|uniref:Uncharacterized protein n=1 Tax=Gymnopus androsaceus JB14 TaxID=1447944 RepID=A0A6A4I2K0_9AGAR|nr:hypothetical protein BT96DRAFT_295733 [Gymnopus androsaceus JB14]
MDPTPQQRSRIEGGNQERQSSYCLLPSSSTNRSFAQSRKRQRGDATASSSSLAEKAQKRLRREELVFQPSYSQMSISPREGAVFSGKDDLGARHPSMTEKGPHSNEDGSGLRSPVFDSEFLHNNFRYLDQVNVEDAARISNLDYSNQQQEPLIDPSMHEDIHGALTQQTRTEESICGRNILLEAPFFAQSHGFTIHNSQFYACSGHGFNQARDEVAPSAAFFVIPRDELRTLSVLYTRKGFRFNSAKRKNCDVVVQVFEGLKAKQTWQKTLKFSRRLVNAHVLDIVGISPSSDSYSDAHYIVFDGAGSRNAGHLIASVLRKGARETTEIGSRVVYGIASALDYISKAVLPLPDLSEDDLEVFSDEFGHTRLAFTPGDSSVMNLEERSSLEPADAALCNSFIGKIFDAANHAVYGDKVQKLEYDMVSAPVALPLTENSYLTSAKAKRPRREIIWDCSGFSSSRSSLVCICQSYGSRIHTENNCLQIPHRFGRSSSKYIHACKDYLREEVTLTPDAFRNAVLIYRQPSLHERCGLCGELQQDDNEEEVRVYNIDASSHLYEYDSIECEISWMASPVPEIEDEDDGNYGDENEMPYYEEEVVYNTDTSSDLYAYDNIEDEISWMASPVPEIEDEDDGSYGDENEMPYYEEEVVYNTDTSSDLYVYDNIEDEISWMASPVPEIEDEDDGNYGDRK